jgi:antitoxin CptB
MDKNIIAEQAMARLRWQCRRGMLELDLMLQAFIDNSYMDLAEDEKAAFQELLSYPDQELLELLLENQQVANKDVANVRDKIRQAVRV